MSSFLATLRISSPQERRGKLSFEAKARATVVFPEQLEP
jgi:hypothetical protein